MRETHSLSVIIPAYNEEVGIKHAVMTNIDVLNKFQLDLEVIIVNDGSFDSTDSIVRENFLNIPHIKYHDKKKNSGFGAAMRTGIELSSKEQVMFVPVDSPLTDEIMQKFYDHINKADILVGYRTERKGYTYRMRLNSWLFHGLVSTLFRMNLKDYNWIHLYRRKIFDGINIEYNGIFMLAEVLIKAKRKGFTIIEFPVEMIKRSGGVATAGSWKAAFQTAGDLFSFYFKKK